MFLRALSLKFLEVNNALNLVDVPEIALHPQWQRNIIDVYESIWENNQLIIVSNSSYIIDNIECKQLRILKKNAEGIRERAEMRQAKDELIKMSNDSTQREIY